MGTNFFRVTRDVGEVATSRSITVTTGAPQLIVLTQSASVLVNLQNNGPAPVSVGDSSMLQGSGDVVFPYANREFYPVSDAWSTYLRADSAATVVYVTEYFPA